MNIQLSKYKYTKKWFINTAIKKTLLNYIDLNKDIKMLEIGCFEGLSSCCFSDNLLHNEKSFLYCIDPFILTGDDPEISSQNITTDTEQIFLDNIKKSKYFQKIKFFKMKSDDFFKINKTKFNIIYIDGCHEPEFINNDLNLLIKKYCKYFYYIKSVF